MTDGPDTLPRMRRLLPALLGAGLLALPAAGIGQGDGEGTPTPTQASETPTPGYGESTGYQPPPAGRGRGAPGEEPRRGGCGGEEPTLSGPDGGPGGGPGGPRGGPGGPGGGPGPGSGPGPGGGGEGQGSNPVPRGVPSGYDQTAWGEPGGVGPSGSEGPTAIVIPVNPNLSLAPRAVVIDGNAETRAVASATLFLDGYYDVQLSEVGLPHQGAVPTWRWSSDGADRTWPDARTLDLPADGATWIVGWLDLNGDKRLKSGDRIGKAVGPLPPADAATSEGSIAVRIDRTHVSLDGPAAVPAQAPVSLGTEYVFEVAAGTDEAAAVADAGFILLGFRPEGVNPIGFPTRGERPRFEWKQAPGPLTWPLRLNVEVPDGEPLWLFAVVDVNGDGALGPGDHVGPATAAFTPPTDGAPVALTIDRLMPGGDPEGGGPPADPTPPGPQPSSGGCGG